MGLRCNHFRSETVFCLHYPAPGFQKVPARISFASLRDSILQNFKQHVWRIAAPLLLCISAILGSFSARDQIMGFIRPSLIITVLIRTEYRYFFILSHDLLILSAVFLHIFSFLQSLFTAKNVFYAGWNGFLYSFSILNWIISRSCSCRPFVSHPWFLESEYR